MSRVVYENLLPIVDPESRWDESGNGRGSFVAAIYEIEEREIDGEKREIDRQLLEVVTVHWEVDSEGLRITNIEARNLTSTMLRFKLDRLRKEIVSQLRDDPERTSGVLMLYRRMVAAAPTDKARAVMEDALQQVGVGPEIVAEQEERVNAAGFVTEAQIQRNGNRRENLETKYKVGLTYIQVYRRLSQNVIEDTQEVLNADQDLARGIAVSSTKIRRYRRAGVLMEAIPGRAGAGPGPLMFEYAEREAPQEISHLERLRDDWQAEIDKKCDEDPKYKARREERE